jgi:hypothetical protein
MSRKIGRTKENELIKVYSAAEKYVVDIDEVTIGQFDTPGEAEEVAKVEMLRSYGLDYEQAREIVGSNIIISYNFLKDWKEKTDQKVEIVQEGNKWVTKINGAPRGESDTKEDAERTADFILVSKQHPKWTVQQCWDYVDQERGS